MRAMSPIVVWEFCQSGITMTFSTLSLMGGILVSAIRGAEEVVLPQGPLLLVRGVQGLEVIVLVETVGGSHDPLSGDQGASTHVVTHHASELNKNSIKVKSFGCGTPHRNYLIFFFTITHVEAHAGDPGELVDLGLDSAHYSVGASLDAALTAGGPHLHVLGG